MPGFILLNFHIQFKRIYLVIALNKIWSLIQLEMDMYALNAATAAAEYSTISISISIK